MSAYRRVEALTELRRRAQRGRCGEMLVCPCSILSTHSSKLLNTQVQDLHDVPGDEADADHESPARDLGEAPDGVTDGDV